MFFCDQRFSYELKHVIKRNLMDYASYITLPGKDMGFMVSKDFNNDIFLLNK